MRGGGTTKLHDETTEWERVHSWTKSALDRLAAEPTSEAERLQKFAVAENERQAKPIVRDLQSIGIPLWDLGELGNVRLLYPAAVPILVKYLAQAVPNDVAMSIVHALAKPYGRAAFDALFAFLERHVKEMSSVQLFSVGNALSENASRLELPLIVKILRNPTYSLAREPLALKAGRWGGKDVDQALTEYLRDGESQWTAIRALRLARNWSAVEDVRGYATSNSSEVRKEVKKYLEARENRMLRKD